MKPLQLLFALVGRFVPIDKDDFNRIQLDAEKWEVEQMDNPTNKVGEFYQKYSRQWYICLALAIAYIPLYKWLQDLMFSTPEDELEEE